MVGYCVIIGYCVIVCDQYFIMCPRSIRDKVTIKSEKSAFVRVFYDKEPYTCARPFDNILIERFLAVVSYFITVLLTFGPCRTM